MTTRGALDSELAAIRNDIVQLGALVIQAVERAIDAFINNDTRLAEEIVKGDITIDGLHHALEERIITTMALQQPMAGDLRKLIADLLITNELERMGDYAEGVGRTTLQRSEGVPPQLSPLMKDMVRLVLNMLGGVASAYQQESPERAREVAWHDDQLDQLYSQYVDTLVTQMGAGELSIEEGTHLMWVAHNLERIGDRVTNIAERVVYARTGALGGLNSKFVRP